MCVLEKEIFLWIGLPVFTLVDICFYINCTEYRPVMLASLPLALVHPLFGLLGMAGPFDDPGKLKLISYVL